jgi:NADH-quinone oxidoreductase subunit N
MNAAYLFALSPFLALACTSIVVMLAAAFCRGHKLAATLTFIGIAASMALLAIAWPMAPLQVTSLLLIDHYALFFMGLIMAATFAVAIFSYDYMEKWDYPTSTGNSPANVERREEYYILLILSTAGASVLVASTHFASFFLGLELLSVPLYALVAYERNRMENIEAGTKYLILAGAASAFLLFGMALIYADLGSMEFQRLASSINEGEYGLITLAGLGMIVVGLGFKLSLVPFHLWAPDVYQGAPAPATAFIATVSKGAVFALLLRYFTALNAQLMDQPVLLFTVLALASMFAGNWLALKQRNVKRMLAYSSIAHMGYLLVAFLASGNLATVAVAYYLTAYTVTTLGAFGIVSVLSTAERDADAPKDYIGLASRRPWLAAVFSLMLLSLAGIPLTAGFIGKFFVLSAGVRDNLWLLVISMAINSAIGLFYYLRTMLLMYRSPVEAQESPRQAERIPLPSSAALLALTLALLWLGLYPTPMIRLIESIL